jgi:hypothetical protein
MDQGYPAGGRRSKETKAWDMRLDCFEQKQVADAVGVSEATISDPKGRDCLTCAHARVAEIDALIAPPARSSGSRSSRGCHRGGASKGTKTPGT